MNSSKYALHYYSVIRVVSVFFANGITMKCVFASGKCILCKLNLRISLVNHFSGANFFVNGLIILVVNHFSGANFSVNQLFIMSMDSNTINKCSRWASSTDYSNGKCFPCKLISWCLSKDVLDYQFVLRVVNALFAN